MAAMRATETEFSQMNKVLAELNSQPDARLFYSLQERALHTESGVQSWMPQMTIGIVTAKVEQQLYPSMSAFIEDMTLIFSDCPYYDSTLNSGATALRRLFSEILSRHTSFLPQCDVTPPGNKKRAVRSVVTPVDLTHELDDVWDEVELDDFLMSYNPELFEVPTEDQVTLLQLSEQMATLESELQLLKDEEDSQFDFSNFAQPGFSAHEEMISKPGSGSTKRVNKAFSILDREQLLFAITHDLPDQYFEGVLRIVNPSFDPDTAREEDLEIDFNSLDDSVLIELQHYVYSSMPARINSPHKRKEVSVPKRKASKKETPKSRIRNQRKNMTRNSVAKPKSPKKAKAKKQRQQPRPSNLKKAIGNADVYNTFRLEEVVRVSKSVEDEVDEVDILD